MERVLIGKPVVAGKALGRALVSREPLSFWGGLDAETGEIIDRRHELSGRTVTGRVLVFPHGKGSSTSSGVLLECIRAGTAPAAIVNLRVAPILALGAVVAEELYHRSLPIVVLPEEAFHSSEEGDVVAVEPDGTVRVSSDGPESR